MQHICDDLKHYRPVSNLPYLGKLTEKIVVKQLQDHIEKYNLDQPLQSAYKKHNSTETAIVKIINDILLALDSDSCVLLILLDLSAAFDTVDHQLLLSRFEHLLGIQSGAKEWLHSYFTDRQQVVRINSTASDPKALDTGMPQGSVLGPFSFPPYTAPLFNIAEKHQCGIHMYADDTQLYMPCKVSEVGAAITRMQDCVRDVRNWMAENFLKLNDDKTEFLVISKCSQVKKVEHVKSITIGDECVSVVPNARNIGCIIDSTVNMESQVNNVSRRCYASIQQIARIRKCLTEEATATLVNSQVTSKLDGFNAILHGLPDTLLDKLQLVQNNAARLITGTKRTPDLKKLHWLPIKFRIEYKILLLCFKALNNMSPKYIKDLLQPYVPRRNLRSSTGGFLVEPPSKLKTYGDRAFSFIAPRLWNKLPEDIRAIDKLNTFKTALKTHLFKQAYKMSGK